jgi:hypothetical protein
MDWGGVDPLKRNCGKAVLLSSSCLPIYPHPSLTQTEFRECDYNKFMSVLDTNKDCEVDFSEYVRSLACLCLYCHEYFKDCPPEPPCSE